MYSPVELGRIDRQIEDLQRLKQSYQNIPQPINNFITTPTSTQPTQPVFEAKFTTENPSDVFIQNKTAFIDLKNGKLSIKETDGELKEYIIILPKDEKDIKIESLERELIEVKNRLNTLSLSSNTNQDLKTNPNIEIQPNDLSNINTPIVVSDYSVDDTKHKKSFVDKLKFKN